MVGPKVQYVAQNDAAVKRQAAIELKRRGKTLDEIAQAVGYANRSSVHHAIRIGMEQSRKEMFTEAEHYRAESLGRLEALLDACWDKAMAGSKDHLGEARRIISDISDLTGAKAPVRFEIGEGDVDRLLAALDARLQQFDARGIETLEGEIVPGEIEASPAQAG